MAKVRLEGMLSLGLMLGAESPCCRSKTVHSFGALSMLDSMLRASLMLHNINRVTNRGS